MAILESVKKLASKVGADTNGRTIAEQINNINRHLDSTGSRDIAEAVGKFADVESGGSTGGGISPSYITYGSYSAPSGPGSAVLDNKRVNFIIVTPDDNGAVSYTAAITEGSSTKGLGSAFVYGENVKRINVDAYLYSHTVTFKAGEDFEGFYYQNEPVTFEGTITAGTWYNALYKNDAVTVETNDYLGYTPIT